MKQWASIRPAMGLLLFLEFLTWAATISGWFVAKSLVPSLTATQIKFVPLLLALPALMTLVMIGHLRWRQKPSSPWPMPAASTVCFQAIAFSCQRGNFSFATRDGGTARRLA